MSHVERNSKYTKLAKLPDRSADSVVQACARVLLPLADRIENTLNSRPRKILGYRTPREVFFNAKNLPVALRC
jgi:IS30 family transposase